MKSKVLSSDLNKSVVRNGCISTALLKENFRRLWPLLILYTLVFIIPTLFIFLIKDYDMVMVNSENLFFNSNFFHTAGYAVLPILTSLVMFKYLYKSGSVSVIHAMPFTRKVLFCTNWLSGLILLVVPILINTALLFPVANQVRTITISDVNIGYSSSIDSSTLWFDLYSPTHIFHWLIISLLIMTFIYAISCLAGMLTGTLIMHAICALLLNYAPMFLFFIIGSYLEVELSGFDLSSFLDDNLKWFSPLWDGNGTMSLLRCTLFIFIIIVSIVLSYQLYKHRRLELTGDSLIFKFADYAAVFFMSLMCTAFICMYIYMYGNTGVIFYTGMAAASLIFLLITNMIVQKTPRIFNRKTFINIVVYAVVIGAFTLSVSHDVLGIKTRVPDVESVSSIKLNAPILSNKPYREGQNVYENYFSDKVFTFKSKEAIDYITAFHKDLVNNPKTLKKAGNTSYYTSEVEWRMGLEYDLASGGKINRLYNITGANLEKNENLLKLLETDEYKQNLTLSKLGYERISDISFCINYVKGIKSNKTNNTDDDEEFYGDELESEYDSYQYFINGDDRNDLLKCLDKDFMEQTADELTSNDMPIANLIFTVKVDNKSNYQTDEFDNHQINYVISSSYDHTIKWLKKKEYYEKLIFTADDIEKINVDVIEYDRTIAQYSITNKDEIKSLYNAGSTSLRNNNKFAVLSLELNDNAKKRQMSIGLSGSGSSYASSRSELEQNISGNINVNRLYIGGSSAAFKKLIQ